MTLNIALIEALRIEAVEWLWRDRKIAFVDTTAENELVDKLRTEGWRLVTAVSPEQIEKLVEFFTTETQRSQSGEDGTVPYLLLASPAKRPRREDL
jgi:hypothetical protein